MSLSMLQCSFCAPVFMNKTSEMVLFLRVWFPGNKTSEILNLLTWGDHFFFFLRIKKKLIYLFLAALNLSCCVGCLHLQQVGAAPGFSCCRSTGSRAPGLRSCGSDTKAQAQ